VHSTGRLPPFGLGLVVGTAVVWFVLELRQSLHRRPEGVRADKGSRFVLRFAVTVGAVVATLVAHAAPAATIGPRAVADWVGLGLLWSGVALRVWSFRTLGHYFTFTVETSDDQPVITAGPYRLIRHPGYAGMLLAIMGVGLFIGNWWSLASLTLGVTCGLVYRIHVEEQALSRGLGDQYRDYAATRKRLIPFLW
jgi:protein-S-isoprenylcysteine O-methyltransferase Ste14